MAQAQVSWPLTGEVLIEKDCTNSPDCTNSFSQTLGETFSQSGLWMLGSPLILRPQENNLNPTKVLLAALCMCGGDTVHAVWS